ncbi:protein kinase domain-containing protein [Yinghuangia sp. YIM S09857]|uniref:protein kinase domain-containing protein n=1 Tax=Yinghuangia sp. YIM S09857 TaxID=3436929 RepID=UPI003F52F91B
MSGLVWGRPLEAWDPERVGPYTLLRLLGEGGMGRVYLARGQGTRLYALKTIRPHLAHDRDFRARFVREARAAQRVSGAFTAPVVGVSDPDEEVPWLATAFVPAPALDEAVSACGVLPERALWWLAAGITEALAAVHVHGLVHRDLKPGNVLIAEDGPRVIDFGIAKALHSVTVYTSTAQIVGTPGYMAPEHLRGAAEPASDIFSLGALLVYAATGRSPFIGPDFFAVMTATFFDAPDLDGVPGGIVELVQDCLAKEAGRRPTPGEILDRFGRYAGPDASAHAARGWLPPRVCALIETRARPEAARDAGPDTTDVPPPPPTRPFAEEQAEHPPPAEESPADEPPADDSAADDSEDGPREDEAPETAADTGTPRRDDAEVRAELVELRARAMDVGDAGEPAQARDAFAALIPDHVRLLGADDPETLEARASYGYWTAKAGDNAAARDLFAALIPDQERVLGTDHLNTLASRFDYLASFVAAPASFDEGRDLCAALAASASRVLGPETREVLHAEFAHAYFVGLAGDTPGAAELFAKVVARQMRYFGPDDPDVLAVRYGQIAWTAMAGDFATARDLCGTLASEQALVLGHDHEDTIVTRLFHAALVGEAGDPDGARDLLAEVVSAAGRVIGPEQETTLSARFSYGRWLGVAGDPAAARDLFAVLVADADRVMGADHQDTLDARRAHARWLAEAGDPATARDLFGALIPDLSKPRVPEERDVLMPPGADELGSGAVEDAAVARDLFASQLDDHTRDFGPDHPDTARVREHHAFWSAAAEADPFATPTQPA